MECITKKEIVGLLDLYIEGKDGNRPGILREIYLPEAIVLFDVRTPKISFPPEIRGNDAIAEVLSADFNRRYLSPRTYYIEDLPETGEDNSIRSLPWLVTMREASTGQVYVGWGLYDWFFVYTPEDSIHPWRIKRHRISIWEMIIMEEKETALLVKLREALSYPWPPPEAVLKYLRRKPQLKGIAELYERRE